MAIDRLQVRRGTATEWTTANPVLADGEPGYEKGTGKVKYGDGVTAWVSLPYASEGPQGEPGVADDASVEALIANPASATRGELNATYAGLIQLAKNPDLLITGNVTRVDGKVTTAAVVWPDGSPGTFTPTYEASGAVESYTITYGSPVTKTFTQPAITRDGSGAATTIPQIVVS